MSSGRSGRRATLRILAAILLFTLLDCLSLPAVTRIAAAGHASPLILTDSQTRYVLGPHEEMLEDRSGTLTIDDVTAAAGLGRFSPLPKGSYNLGFTHSAIWLHCKVINRASGKTRWVLVLRDARLCYVDLYIVPSVAGGVRHKSAGRLSPFHSRDVPHHKFVFDLPLHAGTEERLFLRVKTDTAMNLAAEIRSFESFVHREFNTRLVLGIFVGALLIMIGYHLFLSWSLKDWSYLFYVAFLTCFVINQGAREGLVQQYVSWRWLNSFGLQLFGFLAFAAGLQFSAALLTTRTRFPWIHRIITTLTVLSVMGALLSPFVDFLSLALALLAPAVIATVFLAILAALRQGYSPARYLFLAFAPVLMAFVNHTLTDLGILQSSPFTEYWKWMGMILMVLLLSLALADRIKLIRKEKDRVEAYLRTSEERLRLAWETNPDYLSISRLEDGHMVEVNKGFTDLTGYGPDEVIGRSSLDFGLWHDPRERRDFVSHLLGTDRTQGFEARFRRKEGTVTTVSISAGVMMLNGDRHILATVKDIGPLKQAEQALRESENKYRAMFQHMTSGVAVYDAIDDGKDFVFTDFNPAAERISKVTRGEVLGKPILSVFPNMNRMGLPAVLRKVYNSGFPEHIPASYYEDEHRKGWRENFVYRLPSGEIVAVYNDITDRVTAHQAAEQRMKEQEAVNLMGRQVNAGLSLEEIVHSGLEILAQAVDCDQAMLFLRNGNDLILQEVFPNGEAMAGTFSSVHKMGECLCGLAVRDGKAIFCRNILEDPRCTWTECKNAGLKSVATIPLVTAEEMIGVLALGSFHETDFSGREHFIHLMVHQLTLGMKNALLFSEVRTHGINLERSLEDLKQSQKARETLQNQLMQAQKMEAIGRLAGGIAHDFNNLLTVMMGYSGMLKAQLAHNSPQAEKVLQIQSAAESASNLTKQLLAFSRKQVLDMRIVDLNDVLLDFEKMTRRLLREDIEFVLRCDPSPCRVMADPDQIGQIFLNLAVNARDAMPYGGKMTVETANTFLDSAYAQAHADVEPGPYVVMAFSDSGTGMDAETQSRVFEPFFTTKAKGTGTGLGLSTVLGIVKQHGGHVTLYSEPGIGSTFRIYLPPAGTASENISESTHPRVAAGGGETVLLVEDEARVRNYACELLDSLGYVPLSACGPDEAILLSDTHNGTIHLLLTDVVLPVMDGRSLYDRLHPKRPEMKVLFMSGYTDDAIVHHGVLDTGVYFLQKPFSMAGLAKKLSEVLGRVDLVPEEGVPTGPVPATEMDDEVMARKIATLPHDLLTDLSTAVLEANKRKTEEAVKRIVPHDEALALEMERLVSHFRFDKIRELIEQTR